MSHAPKAESREVGFWSNLPGDPPDFDVFIFGVGGSQRLPAVCAANSVEQESRPSAGG
jgi:hypothetical protein